MPSFLDHEPAVSRLGHTPQYDEPAEPEIELMPLPTERSAAEPISEVSFLPDPLPEFDPVAASSTPDLEPEAIVMAPPTPEAPDEEPEAGHAFVQTPAPVSAPHTDAEREAVAPGLVTLVTETGLPKIAPFILDAPAAPVVEEPARMRSVVIRIGKLSATHFLLKDVTTIGRPDSVTQNYPDIEIELDDGVSRRHAEIRHAGPEFAIVDVGSTNGTLLNGDRLTPNEPVTLQSGDRIRVGERTELQFE